MLKLCGCGVGGRAAQAPGSFVSRARGASLDDEWMKNRRKVEIIDL